MSINISHSIISPPSYVPKTDESGWYMQIGSRDSMTASNFSGSKVTCIDLTGLIRP